MLFQWYEQKRLENLNKHGIDFLDAKEIERTRNECRVKVARDKRFWVQGTLPPW